MSFESIMGLAIVAGFGIYLMKDRAKCTTGDAREEGAAHDAESEFASPSDGEWCSLLERACDCAAFCFDDTMRFVSCGDEARHMVGDCDGEMSHLIDVFPSAVANEILRGAAAARRGEMSSRRLLWEGAEMDARFMPLGAKAIAVLIGRRRA